MTSPRLTLCARPLASLVSAIFALGVWSAPVSAGETAGGAIDYAAEIKPIFKRHCLACHGALRQKGGLRLDTAAAILRGGESGPAVVPHNSGESLLVEHVTSEANRAPHMPPEGEGEPLSPVQIAKLTSWIDQGAVPPAKEEPEPDPRSHWAFRPVVRPAVPAVENSAWVKNPIDNFIALRHERLSLRPRPAAAGNRPGQADPADHRLKRRRRRGRELAFTVRGQK